jgi:hypothetical protein
MLVLFADEAIAWASATAIQGRKFSQTIFGRGLLDITLALIGISIAGSLISWLLPSKP